MDLEKEIIIKKLIRQRQLLNEIINIYTEFNKLSPKSKFLKQQKAFIKHAIIIIIRSEKTINKQISPDTRELIKRYKAMT
jgi:hypothetical protein